MSEPQTIGDVLMAAADELEEHGWCVGLVEDAAGQMCALGALNKVIHGDAHGMLWGDGVQSELHIECRKALLRARGAEHSLGYGVANINNTQIKDKQDAVEWFQKAAANSGLTLKEKQ